MQVANDPVRIAISVLNSNYTCDLIKESGIFALSLLDVECSFETIKHFGFQSGRDVDKICLLYTSRILMKDPTWKDSAKQDEQD